MEAEERKELAELLVLVQRMESGMVAMVEAHAKMHALAKQAAEAGLAVRQKLEGMLARESSAPPTEG